MADSTSSAEHARCLGCRIQAAETEGNTATPCTCSAESARPLYTPCPSCLRRHDPLGSCPADDPTYCWADPHNRHQWDGRGVCNESGRTLAYICRWCTREVAEIPTPPGTPTSHPVEATP